MDFDSVANDINLQIEPIPKKTFNGEILSILGNKGLILSTFYKQCRMHNNFLSKKTKPQLSTVVTACLALKLAPEKTEELVRLAGYSLDGQTTVERIYKYLIYQDLKLEIDEYNEILIKAGLEKYMFGSKYYNSHTSQVNNDIK